MIRFNAPVVREVEGSIRLTRGRPIVVRATDQGISFREKGRRTWFGPLPWDSLFGQAVRLEADRIARDKRAARLARKASKTTRRR